jgi:carbonic anhydrase
MDELNKLFEGNKRFVSGQMKAKDLKKSRESVINGQKPFVTIVSCSDSRVVPEFIFDADIGELFIVRLAGNIADSCALGSVEYGTEHLHTPLLVVLGHEKCGAVTAACKGFCENNYISDVVKKITPAVCKAGKDNVEYTIDENIRCVKAYLESTSNVIKELVEHKKLKIVGMKYSLTDGSVKLID